MNLEYSAPPSFNVSKFKLKNRRPCMIHEHWTLNTRKSSPFANHQKTNNMTKYDKLIDDYILTKNFTHALRLVTDKIKQYPNTSYFYALEAQVLALSGEHNKAIDKANNLLARFPSDVSTLKLLIDVYDLCDYTPKEDVFEKVSKKYPTFQLIQEWLDHAIENFDILGMQKATMMLTKSVSSSGQSEQNNKIIKLWAAASFMLACNCCKSQLKPIQVKLYKLD
ncbi:unnamed protein product [Ambrosiozyma monospora]|uniref:Unnamed protein product n=1 Tax=Ambrosiozyma monospora TaxID=43982 RepID=A0ACB5TB36_AMBMO|nr:unnamed protein product [Ambrosiozyma monospora]